MENGFRIHNTLNCEREMKPISGIVDSVSELVGQLTLPARERKELEAGLLKLIQEWERELTRARASVVRDEVKGNWLQRSWRPLVMLVFGTFTSLQILADTSRFWDLLEIGLGGYVVGRSGEKMAKAIFKIKGKN